jgi:hypothetical protein
MCTCEVCYVCVCVCVCLCVCVCKCEYMYHTSSGRAAAGVRFFGTSDNGDPLALLKGDSSLLTKDVLSNNFPVPTKETTYHEQCYDVGTLLGVKKKKVHVLKAHVSL